MAEDESELGPAGEPELLRLSEACDALLAPDAHEVFSAACGRPWLAVELGGQAGVPDAGPALAEALGGLACTSIALLPDGADDPDELAEAFDVVAESRADLAELVARVEATPLAATALVQLLRGQAERAGEQGLVAESFVYSTLQAGPEFAAWLAQQPTLRPALPERPPVRVTREGARLDVVLDQPEKRNAYSALMRDALCEALELALHDDGIREIELHGRGPAFCAGGDLDEFGLLADPATAHAIRTTRSAGRLLARLAPRVRASLHGACIGAGIELPAFAGQVHAAGDAFFQLPELAMGLVPGAGGTVSLTRRMGRQRTAWLALGGRRLEPERARSLGLVDVVD